MRGRSEGFRPLSASRQLAVNGIYPALVPGLLRRGLGPEDAVALAYNTAFLYLALECTPPLKRPGDLLDRYSLGEIARLCEACALEQEQRDKGEVEDDEHTQGFGAQPQDLQGAVGEP